MKKLFFIPIALMLLVSVSSCEKFDEGGAVKKADTRITGTWKFDQYLRNGTDETSLVLISNYVESYNEDATYPRSYISGTGRSVEEAGRWELTSDQKQLRIMDVSSIEDFSDNNTTLSSSTYNILKLNKDELWYYYENGGDTHEFRFVK